MEYFKVEVIADNSGKWCSNQLRFAAIDTARVYARDLFNRWTAVVNWRIVDQDGVVVAGRTERVN
jgi:hypothetical protein